jgi:hypothetical protein
MCANQRRTRGSAVYQHPPPLLGLPLGLTPISSPLVGHGGNENSGIDWHQPCHLQGDEA